MSKIKKGIKVLLTEGPGGIVKAVKRSKQIQSEAERFRQQAKSFHLVSEEELQRQRETVFQTPVTFSILTPLYNTPELFLRELIQSLQAQTYKNWELCLADGSDGAHAYVGRICKEYAKTDSRIKYHVLAENRGISENTNACIKLASGAYFGLLDHDDVLHPSALYEMMAAITRTQADFLYSDEVKFHGNTEDAVDFNFKPDFGKDELRSHNYICHFTVFSRTLLEKAGQVYRPEFDGSQDHDMVLRLTEQAGTILHIPKVLYYWRVHENSVSMNLESKSYAVDAAIRAVSEQLERCGEPGTVASNLPYQTIYRIRYQIPQNAKTAVCVHQLDTTEEFEIIKERLASFSTYKELEFLPIYRKDAEAAKSGGVCWNAAVRSTNAEYIIMLHAKCFPVTADWIEELLMYAQRKDVCAVGPQILFSDQTICYAGIALDITAQNRLRFLCRGANVQDQGYEAMLRHVRNTTAVWNGCFMVQAETLKMLGGFSEEVNGYEEIDLCLRGREQNLWNVWTCFSQLKYEGTDLQEAYEAADTKRFHARWQKRLQADDPYCHANLRKLSLL